MQQMKIKAITKYTFNGKEYHSLHDVKEELHNTIGLEVLDKINKTCPLAKHKDYEKLLELLCSKDVRKVLVDCLTVTYDIYEDDDGDYSMTNDADGKRITKNVLDL